MTVRCSHLVLLLLAAGEVTISKGTVSTPSGPTREMRLYPSGSGYIVDNNRFLWTSDWGDSWSDRTPRTRSDGSPNAIGGVCFRTQSDGWIETHDDSQPARISLSHTRDGGKQWVTEQFTAPDKNLRAGYAGETSLSFLDKTNGWLLTAQISGSAQRTGALFATSDGGVTWSPLPYPPTAGRIVFTSKNVGWLAGGSRSVFLYRTEDAGRSWVRQNVPIPSELAGLNVVDYSLPYSDNTGAALLTVLFDAVGGPPTMAIYSSGDPSRGWLFQNKFVGIPNALISVSVLTNLKPVVAFMDGNKIIITNTGGASAHAVRLPFPSRGHYGILDMAFGDKLHGWVHIYGDRDLGERRGYASFTAWIKTGDGGSTFTPLFRK